MIWSSILEYVEALRNRYYGASKKERGKMLDEFTQVTGHDPVRLALRVELGVVSLLGSSWVKKQKGG